MDDTVALLQQRPGLAMTATVASFAANADKLRAGIGLANTLQVLLTEVQATNQANETTCWAGVRTVYNAAKPLAEGDAVVAHGIVPITGLFTRTKRDVSAVQIAATDSLKVTKATARVTKATQNLATANARAATLQHGTGDATITQPAPGTTATPAAPGSAPTR